MNKLCKSKADGNVFKSMFVGMDVHKNYLQVAVLDEKGKILNNSRVDNNPTILLEQITSCIMFSSSKIIDWNHR